MTHCSATGSEGGGWVPEGRRVRRGGNTSSYEIKNKGTSLPAGLFAGRAMFKRTCTRIDYTRT